MPTLYHVPPSAISYTDMGTPFDTMAICLELVLDPALILALVVERYL